MQNPRTEIEAIAGTDDIRLYLHHVYVDRSKNRLVATNGSAMAFVPVTPDDFDDNDTSGYLSVDAIKAARKNRLYPSAPNAIGLNGAQQILNGPSFPRPTEAEIGKFPDVDRVANPERSQAYICLDAALLLKLAKALNKKGASSQTVRIFLPYDGATALRVEPVDASAAPGAFGVLMPVREKDRASDMREVYPRS